MVHLPTSLNEMPPILNYPAYYQCISPFTGGSVGDIFVRISFISTRNSIGIAGAEAEPFAQIWLNHNTLQIFPFSEIDINNLDYIKPSDVQGIITAVNKVSSSLSDIKGLDTTILGSVSSGISSIININNAGNAYLSQISNTLANAYATASLFVDNIPVAGTKTYTGVRSALITPQPVLLASTLNSSSINVNGATCSLNTPIAIPIPQNTKLSNNLIVSGGNIAVTVIYTT